MATTGQLGALIAVGSTSFVEKLPSGNIIKRPWPTQDCIHERRRELAIESRIYDLLGPHACLVNKISWDPKEYVLELEFMPNGTVRDYIRADGGIPLDQRLKWIEQAAEGVHLLHASDIVHCDIGPRNFLLDADLNLKICDFSGSSIGGSSTQVLAGARYTSPAHDCEYPVPESDIFALGSTIYFIMTGGSPFGDMASLEVTDRFQALDFPSLEGILCGDIIHRCWHGQIESAAKVARLIRELACEY
ncbi:Serine/threonine protein kinase [Geosmithia morbida]|uniref:Serine/threonine protein kinase n=1 Tax=Geosmithia morbida TaxID=1094350 RepID=A0A9P4YSN2_9HYPO|nr:Serine/threonine protein kinase [Geosmithia morbida]KAF4120926.1 Serine/threonine protein kinase [Geosmithia morbida]